MDFSLSEEQRALVDFARKFAKKKLLSIHVQKTNIAAALFDRRFNQLASQPIE